MAPNDDIMRTQLLNFYHEDVPQETIPCVQQHCAPGNACPTKEDGFHNFYLKKGRPHYHAPVVFEDGMDFAECELYYVSLDSQSKGGCPRASLLQKRHERPSCFRKPRRSLSNNNQNNNSMTCLKSPKRRTKTIEKSKRMIRRCSFSGLPVQGNLPTLTLKPLKRSNSSCDLKEHTPRVAFEEYVQVATIYSAKELPLDVRSQMWLSKQELAQGMRLYVLEQRKKQMNEASAASAASAATNLPVGQAMHET